MGPEDSSSPQLMSKASTPAQLALDSLSSLSLYPPVTCLTVAASCT